MIKIAVLLVVYCCITAIVGDSEPQREEILFERVDNNLDGYLTRAELDALFLKFDVNHDGSITKREFDNDWVIIIKIGNQKEADLLFNHADVNDDGVIDSKDLPLIFVYFDTNGDGNVSIDEFLTQWGVLTLAASGSGTTTTIPTSSV